MMTKLSKLVVCAMLLAIPLVALSPKLAQAKSEKTTQEENAVYSTKNGKKYHKAGCRFIKNRDTVSLSEEEAKAKGLVPCGRCFEKKE